jgi:hypothetical protein
VSWVGLAGVEYQWAAGSEMSKISSGRALLTIQCDYDRNFALCYGEFILPFILLLT